AQAGFERGRQQSIVRIEKDDIASRYVGEAFVPCRALTLVVLCDTTDRPVSAGDCDGIVRGSVVDDDNLDERMGLRLDALDCLSEKPRLVVAGNHHRHELWERELGCSHVYTWDLGTYPFNRPQLSLGVIRCRTHTSGLDQTLCSRYFSSDSTTRLHNHRGRPKNSRLSISFQRLP